MIRPLVVGNWKMQKTIREAIAFVDLLQRRLEVTEDKTVAVAPPFTALYPVAEALKGTGISLAAQNVCDREEGAYTGEVSARMLVDAGCRYVIIGHSERRALFGEGDDLINRKIKASLPYDLTPIVCIGETLSERESGDTFTILERQIKKGLKDIVASDAARIVMAYEPVWAIGTGKTAQPEQAAEVHVFIREMVEKEYGKDVSLNVPVIYGGSVNPANIAALMARPEIDGVLVGGASLDVESFARIVGA
jgi:triosephosphate isomerase (TIM)